MKKIFSIVLLVVVPLLFSSCYTVIKLPRPKISERRREDKEEWQEPCCMRCPWCYHWDYYYYYPWWYDYYHDDYEHAPVQPRERRRYERRRSFGRTLLDAMRAIGGSKEEKKSEEEDTEKKEERHTPAERRRGL
ncbi:hypothetical protein J7K18_05210 [bacterium]|nr:hypothetical protein [bacterium]